MKSLGPRRASASAARYRIAVVMSALSSLVVSAGIVHSASAAATATSVEVVASASARTTDAQNSISIPRPAGIGSGHVVVAAVALFGAPDSLRTPTGWSRVRTDRNGNGVGQALFVRVASGAEPSSYTFSLSGKAQLAAGVTAYSGVEPADPIEAHGALTQTGGPVVAPSLPVSNTGTRLLNVTAANVNGTVAPPAGMTERFEAVSPAAKGNKHVVVALADQAMTGAGSTGPRTATVSPAAPSIGAAVLLRLEGTMPPPPPPNGDPVLVGSGDIASCSNNNDEATAQLVDSVVADYPQATVFTVGDNVYDSGTASQFADCYAPTWGRHKARTRPAAGNHEYVTTGATPYYNYFGAAAGTPGQGWYDYMEGGWHVVVLNTNCASVGGCHAGSAQEQWLRSRLSAVSAECTVAMWHHPLFSSGAHGSSNAAAALWQALYEHGTELVISGHDHIYERFAPQTAAGVLDNVYGVRQITAGLGGRSLYGYNSVAPNSQFRYNSGYGVLKLTLHPGSYDFTMLRAGGGSPIDSGSGTCHGAPPLAPPPPPPPPGSGPIAAVGSSFSGASTAQPSLTLARPAGLAAGQVMVAQIVSNDAAPGFTTPAGWTLVSDQIVGTVIRQAVYYRVAGSNEPASYTWPLETATTRRIAGGLTAYSGVDTSSPIAAHAASVNSVASTSVAAPSLNAPVADTMLLHLAAVNAEGSVTPPAGMTERWEADSPNTSSTRDALATAADVGVASAGATGVRTATVSASGPSIGLSLLLHPAPAA